MDLNTTKSLVTSKTFWGAAVAVAASVAGLAGFTVSAADQITLVDQIDRLIAVAGAGYAIYGRVVASRKIG